MSDPTETAAAAAPFRPSMEARASQEGGPSTRMGGEAPLKSPEAEARVARLTKFKREQLIVDYLNRGVSVAEIAARIGVGEKRMRAVIRDIIARRQPHPPEEFVAIQVSRLNEALLVAYSAMSPENLRAVALVVRIVHDLDRYHGVASAGRLPKTSPRIEIPSSGAYERLYGGALFCRAELRSGLDDGPEILTQGVEDVGFAPGIDSGRPAGARHGEERGDRTDPGVARDDSGALAQASDCARERDPTSPAGDDCPEMPPQGLENTDFAPGTNSAPRGGVRARSAASDDAPPPQPETRTARGGGIRRRTARAIAVERRRWATIARKPRCNPLKSRYPRPASRTVGRAARAGQADTRRGRL